MKKYLLIILTFLFCSNLFAQIPDSIVTRTEFHAEISKLANKLRSLEKNNSDLERTNSLQRKQIESVTSQLSVEQSNIQHIADSLKITLKNVSNVNKRTQGQIIGLNQTITNRTLYWIIGILTITLLIVTALLLLKNKLSLSTKNLDGQIAKTNETLLNEAIKLDSKLVEILQSQLSILNAELKTKGTTSSEADHKLPLKVGDEIHRMRKRIENMPQDIKGLSALTNSLQRLEEEFNDSGYEIEDLLGKKYIDGMKVEARFVDNPDIPKGEEIITDVLRPQIIYKGVVMQFAKVEVGKSY